MTEEAGPSQSMFTGKPTGTEVELPRGIKAYIAKPPEGGKRKRGTSGVILLSDHEGWKATNIRLYADKFAKDGQLAAVPDLFMGDNPPLKEMKMGNYDGYQEWQARHTEEQVLADIDKLLADLREQYSIENFGAVGFCIGALHSALLAGGDKVQATVLNHGRNLRKDLFRDAKKPMLVNWAENDDQMPPEERDAYDDILKEMKGTLPSDSKVFEGTEHGWTLQNTPVTQEAFDRASAWFSKYL